MTRQIVTATVVVVVYLLHLTIRQATRHLPLPHQYHIGIKE